MAGPQVGWAVVGAAFGALVTPIKWLVSKAWNFKSTRRDLESRVKHDIPVVKEMGKMDEILNHPKEEIGRLMEKLEEGQEVVAKLLNVPWWKCCCLPCYQYKLQAQTDAVKRSLSDLLLIIARDTKETLVTVKNSGQLMGRFWAPENSHRIVGLDRPFSKLKKQLLERGASVFVLTGLAGSGKTTLATLLYWDEQVRGKFGGNIFFVIVSKTPNLMTIVQTLFYNCGRKVPVLVNHEHAVTQLKSLLKEIGKSPIMMVLDDVWPGSESLIQAFQEVQVSDYKVLVTSRVEFPRFGTSCHLEPLGPEDAVTLFRHFALLKENDEGRRPCIPDENLVSQVARACWGSPLALELIGRSLCRQPIEVWQKMEKLLSKGRSIVVSNTELLNSLQKCLDDLLEDKPIIKECFNDLGLFPDDRKIPVAALIDMWTELHKLDDGDIDAMNIIYELTNRHLVNLTREVASDEDNYYNHHFLMQHDLLREITIHQARQEPFEQRKRLTFDINENNWPLQNHQQSVAHTLSISTDKMVTPDWSNTLKAEAVEVLVLNLRTNKYTLPEFMLKMSELKVLIVTNYGDFHFSEINKFELLRSLSSLKRIRLEQVSVPSLGKLNNLRKLSLYMCDTSQAFQSDTIPISDALPNLEELSIDNSKDLVELPAGLSDITSLKKLNITKCSRLSVLPQDIGNLVNLEMLRLNSCSKLGLIPASIGRLGLLCFLDISGCASLGNLPEEIGDLGNLTKLHMTDCSRCELPQSVTKLQNLSIVVCDDKTAASWALFKHSLPKLDVKKADVKAYLFSGGAVGAVMQETLETIMEASQEILDEGPDFRPTLERHIDTLEALAPLVEEIKRYSKALNRPSEEVERLDNEIKARKELATSHSKLPCWKFSFPRYRGRLLAMDGNLSGRYLSADVQVNVQVNVQAQMARDSMETLSKVREALEILKK